MVGRGDGRGAPGLHHPYQRGRYRARTALQALPPEMARWSMTTLPEKLVKIGARLTPRARRLILQMAEVAVTRDLFAQIIDRVRLPSPVPS